MLPEKKKLLIVLCSWNYPKMLEACVDSLLKAKNSIDYDIAVVLNEGDKESMDFLREKNIYFFYSPKNHGVLAIDFLMPLILFYEYVINSNDDMIFCKGFAEDVIALMETDNYCSVSLSLVENFGSGNHAVIIDKTLKSVLDKDSVDTFMENHKNGKYFFDHLKISYHHPICVRSTDWFGVGGYADNWNEKFSSGYSMDDYFAYKLVIKHEGKKPPVLCNKSFVFHESSASMHRLPNEIRNNNNLDKFKEATEMDMMNFRSQIQCGRGIK